MWDYASWKAATFRSPFDQAPLQPLADVMRRARIVAACLASGFIQPEYTDIQRRRLRRLGLA